VLQLDTGIDVTPQTVRVEAGKSADSALTLSAQMDAPIGENTKFIDQVAFNQRRGLVLSVNMNPFDANPLVQTIKNVSVVPEPNAITINCDTGWPSKPG
jgi:hypothetical protein